MKRTNKLFKIIISIIIASMVFYIVPSISTISTNGVYAVSINKRSTTIKKGNTYKLKIKGTKKQVKWYSSNNKVASVNSSGKVTAKKSGKATITAKVGKRKYRCVIKVTDPRLNQTSKTLLKGKSFTLKVYGISGRVKWSTSNKKIATVNSRGKVTAKKAGRVTITAKVNGQKIRCNVEVVNKGISRSDITLSKNETYTINTYGLSNVRWSSGNDSIASVDRYGHVRAKKRGTTRIYAKSGRDTYSCMVTVSYKVDTGWKISNGKTYYYSSEGEKYIGWNTIDGRRYYFDSNGELKSYTGIDVSSYQKEINWSNVKRDDIDFAIVRAAYRGYTKGGIVKDTYFDKNIKEATAAGVKVGAYFFSQAITEEEAEEEAKYIVNLVKPYKTKLPIIIDTEYSNKKHDGRADDLSVEERTLIVKAFCNKVSSLGYSPMIYASKNWFNNNLDMTKLSKYSCWVAHYTSSVTDYQGKYDIWQYTSTGNVGGIVGNVDMDVTLKRY